MFFKTHIRWVDLMTEKEFKETYQEGKIKAVKVEEHVCLSVNVKNSLKVFEKSCPHQRASLLSTLFAREMKSYVHGISMRLTWIQVETCLLRETH